MLYDLIYDFGSESDWAVVKQIKGKIGKPTTIEQCVIVLITEEDEEIHVPMTYQDGIIHQFCVKVGDEVNSSGCVFAKVEWDGKGQRLEQDQDGDHMLIIRSSEMEKMLIFDHEDHWFVLYTSGTVLSDQNDRNGALAEQWDFEISRPVVDSDASGLWIWEAIMEDNESVGVNYIGQPIWRRPNCGEMLLIQAGKCPFTTTLEFENKSVKAEPTFTPAKVQEEAEAGWGAIFKKMGG